MRHVQQRGDPWQRILAGGGGRGQDVGVAARQPDHQCRHIFGELVGVVWGVGDQYFFDTRDLGGGFGNRPAVVAGHQHGDILAQLRGGGDGVQGRRLEGSVVVFGNDQDAHDSIPAGLDDVGFVVQLVHQFGDAADLDAGLALGRFLHLQGDQSRRDVHAQIGRLEHLQRLFLGFHDVG